MKPDTAEALRVATTHPHLPLPIDQQVGCNVVGRLEATMRHLKYGKTARAKAEINELLEFLRPHQPRPRTALCGVRGPRRQVEDPAGDV